MPTRCRLGVAESNRWLPSFSQAAHPGGFLCDRGFLPLSGEYSTKDGTPRGRKAVIASRHVSPRAYPPSRTASVWYRAAALGSLWAAFEIVVGSFLHNLRVPFAGTMMATASVFLVTAAVQVWTERGLVWRTALVCALMKSVSPSAVLLSPMIGIFAEGLLLQLSLRFLGRSWLGCAVGGALAVSYTLLQKIVSLTVIYGFDLVRVFAGLVQFASRITGWQGLQPVSVLLALASIQGALGIAAGLAGWYIGGRVRLRNPDSLEDILQPEASQPRQNDVGFHRSLLWLGALLLALPVGLWFTGAVPLPLSAPVVAAATTGILIRYRRTAGRLMNPRLWGEILLMALLSGLVLGAAGGDIGKGLLAGGRMALRAGLVVALFASIGVELTHPRILRLLSRGRLAVVHAAVQSAFQALPDFLASLPDLKEVLRDPIEVLARLFYRVDRWQQRFEMRRRVILTGERGEGKTTLCLALAEEARRAGWTVGGIVTPGRWDNGQREGYRIRDLLTGEERPLASRSGGGTMRVGSFSFASEGIAFGRQALEAALAAKVQLLIVDEVGLLELRGDGWAPVLEHLHAGAPGAMIWVVRPELVEAVRKRYPLFASAPVVRALETDVRELMDATLGG